MSRLTPVDPATYTQAQQRVHSEIARLRNNAVSGPFSAWIRLPEVAGSANALGDALRSSPVLPARLYRLAALVAARHWRAGYAWSIHAPRGCEAGLDAVAIDRLRRGEPPAFPDARDAQAYALLTALTERRTVSDGEYRHAEALLGSETLVALVATAGFFTMAAMSIVAFSIPAPNAQDPFAD